MCSTIEAAANKQGLPPGFFAKLIWKESRFDPNAISPAGAEGIAQFMPYTAANWGLENSFEPVEAIEASSACWDIFLKVTATLGWRPRPTMPGKTVSTTGAVGAGASR